MVIASALFTLSADHRIRVPVLHLGFHFAGSGTWHEWASRAMGSPALRAGQRSGSGLHRRGFAACAAGSPWVPSAAGPS